MKVAPAHEPVDLGSRETTWPPLPGRVVSWHAFRATKGKNHQNSILSIIVNLRPAAREGLLAADFAAGGRRRQAELSQQIAVWSRIVHARLKGNKIKEKKCKFKGTKLQQINELKIASASKNV